MNVYRITEDGRTVCVAAESMQGAILQRARAFVEEDRNAGYGYSDPAEYYGRQLLESCELVGELAEQPRSSTALEPLQEWFDRELAGLNRTGYGYLRPEHHGKVFDLLQDREAAIVRSLGATL